MSKRNVWWTDGEGGRQLCEATKVKQEEQKRKKEKKKRRSDELW